MAQCQFQEKEKQAVPRTTIQHRCIIRAEQYWASGLLGHVTFSTVGVLPGVYNLRMANMASAGGGSHTDFAIVVPTVTNGTITVVPEPASIALAAFAFVGLAACGWRRRKR